MAKLISEETRQKTALVSSILSLVCIIPSMMLFSAGFYIQVAVGRKIRLIEGFDVAALPGCITAVGFLSMMYNSTSSACVFLSRRKKKRKDLTRCLFPIAVTGIVLFTAIFIVGLLCFSQIHHLSKSFQRGIYHAMAKYKTDMHMKEEIDVLQIDYRCCGSEKYTDWFNTSWQHEDYLDGDRLQNIVLSKDSVPFSCCDPSSKRPCVHQHVHDNDQHFSYDFRASTTLHSVGCRQALVSFYGDGLLTDVGALIIAISFLQITAVVLTRVVQTSMLNAIHNGDPFGPAVGYIFCYENVWGDKDDTIPLEPMLSDSNVFPDDNEYITDSTFDDLSDDDEENVIANEPLYANASIINTPLTSGEEDRVSRPGNKVSEPLYSNIYELPHSSTKPTGQRPPSPLQPPLPKRPSVPAFQAPLPPSQPLPPKHSSLAMLNSPPPASQSPPTNRRSVPKFQPPPPPPPSNILPPTSNGPPSVPKFQAPPPPPPSDVLSPTSHERLVPAVKKM